MSRHKELRGALGHGLCIHPSLSIAGVGELVQQKSHWQKIKNISELQKQFLVSNTVQQKMQVLHKMTYIHQVA